MNNATYASSFLFFQYPVDLAVEIFLGSIIQEPVVGKFNASREILLVGIGRVHLARFIGEKFFKRYFIRFGAARNDPFQQKHECRVCAFRQARPPSRN